MFILINRRQKIALGILLAIFIIVPAVIFNVPYTEREYESIAKYEERLSSTQPYIQDWPQYRCLPRDDGMCGIEEDHIIRYAVYNYEDQLGKFYVSLSFHTKDFKLISRSKSFRSFSVGPNSKESRFIHMGAITSKKPPNAYYFLLRLDKPKKPATLFNRWIRNVQEYI